MTKKTLSWFGALLFVGAVMGCGSSSKKETTPPPTEMMAPGADAGAPTSMAPTGNPCSESATATGNPCSK